MRAQKYFLSCVCVAEAHVELLYFCLRLEAAVPFRFAVVSKLPL